MSNAINYAGKYIAHLKIVGVKAIDEKTPDGKLICEVLFDDKTTQKIPVLVLDEIITDEPSDLTTVENKRVLKVTRAILELFAEYDIKLREWEKIEFTIKGSIDENFGRATAALWGTEEKTWLDMIRVLNKHNVKPIEHE